MKRMKRWLWIGAVLAAPVVLAQPADKAASNETWIPLEDLPVDDQNAALDAADGDAAKQPSAGTWSDAAEQLVIHAI